MTWAQSGITCMCVAMRLGRALEQPGTLACWSNPVRLHAGGANLPSITKRKAC